MNDGNNNNNNDNIKNEMLIDKKKLYNDFTTIYVVSNLFDADVSYKINKYCSGDVEPDTII